MRRRWLVGAVTGALLTSGLLASGPTLAAPDEVLVGSAVSIAAARPKVEHGEPVRLRGRVDGRWARGAELIVQQRTTGDDDWDRFGATTVDRDNGWRLSRTAVRGSTDYRAVVRGPAGLVKSSVVTVVARWTPKVTASIDRDLDMNYWLYTITGTAHGAEGTSAALWSNWTGTWRPMTEYAPVRANGHYQLEFQYTVEGQVKVCIHKDPDVGRKTACSRELTPDTSRFPAELELSDVVSGVDEMDSDADGNVDVYDQHTEVSVDTTMPPGSMIRFETRPRGTADWSTQYSILTSTTGTFTLRLPPFPDGSEVRAVPDGGAIDAGPSVTWPFDLTPIDVSLDQVPYEVTNIAPTRGAELLVDLEQGQVFHAFVAGLDPQADLAVHLPDGTPLLATRLTTGNDVHESVEYFIAPQSATYTVALSSKYIFRVGASARITSPRQSSGPAYGDALVTPAARSTAEHHFTGEAGQVITLDPFAASDTRCGWYDLVAADDRDHPLTTVEPAWLPLYGSTLFFVLPADGDYLWRVATEYPCYNPQRLRTVAPTMTSATAGRSSFDVEVAPGGWMGVTFEASAGDHIWVQTVGSPGYDFLHDDDFPPQSFERAFVTAPDGSVIRPDFVAETTGTYTYWAGPDQPVDGATTYSVIVELRRD